MLLICTAANSYRGCPAKPYIHFEGQGMKVPPLAPRRLAVSMYRREQALKDLPGPKHPFLVGMMVDLVCRRDPHRYATELAEQYGPIFKFRLLIFHVSASVCFPFNLTGDCVRIAAPSMQAVPTNSRQRTCRQSLFPWCSCITLR